MRERDLFCFVCVGGSGVNELVRRNVECDEVDGDVVRSWEVLKIECCECLLLVLNTIFSGVW